MAKIGFKAFCDLCKESGFDCTKRNDDLYWLVRRYDREPSFVGDYSEVVAWMGGRSFRDLELRKEFKAFAVVSE